MSSLDKAIRSGRRLSRNARSAATTALAGGETMQAAGDVIAARLEIMARGLADPTRADLREMALMSSEKVEALSASAAATAQAIGTIGGRLTTDAAAELNQAGRAAAAMATASTPAAAAAIQFDYAVGWWSRAAGQMLSLNSAVLKAQAEALAPIHKTATANARRLRK